MTQREPSGVRWTFACADRHPRRRIGIGVEGAFFLSRGFPLYLRIVLCESALLKIYSIITHRIRTPEAYYIKNHKLPFAQNVNASTNGNTNQIHTRSKIHVTAKGLQTSRKLYGKHDFWAYEMNFQCLLKINACGIFLSILIYNVLSVWKYMN